jgi:hypothetical protein
LAKGLSSIGQKFVRLEIQVTWAGASLPRCAKCNRERSRLRTDRRPRRHALAAHGAAALNELAAVKHRGSEAVLRANGRDCKAILADGDRDVAGVVHAPVGGHVEEPVEADVLDGFAEARVRAAGR